MNNCLSYQQLHDYSLHQLSGAERDQLYQHISSCEMCAAAVNGFASLPFSFDELVAIHHQIDRKANATGANPLVAVQVLVVIISLLSVLGVYTLADHIGKRSAIATIETKQPQQLETKPVVMLPASKEEVKEVQRKAKRILHRIREKRYVDKLAVPEVLPSIASDAALLSSTEETMKIEDPKMEVIDPDVIYIYDLKVAEYSSLYFDFQRQDAFLNRHHVPVEKENKDALDAEKDNLQSTVALDRILKNGLRYFGKQQYEKALQQFATLLEWNASDENALFYSAVSLIHLGYYDQAKVQLKQLLTLENKSFVPETQWQLALLCLKTGEKEEGRNLLKQLVDQNGFYSKKAAEKLKKA